MWLGTIPTSRHISLACVSFFHYDEALLVVMVLQVDPLVYSKYSKFDFLVSYVFLPVVLLLVPLVLVHVWVHLHFPHFEHALETIVQ